MRILYFSVLLLALPGIGRAQFSFTTSAGEVTITGYNSAAGRNAVIPTTINGLPVRRIADFALASNHQITNVV